MIHRDLNFLSEIRKGWLLIGNCVEHKLTRQKKAKNKPEWAFFRERQCVQRHGNEKSTVHSGKYKSFNMARKERKKYGRSRK